MRTSETTGYGGFVTSGPCRTGSLHATMSAMRRFLYTACCAAVLAACAGADATAIDRDRFVTTVVELRQAAMQTRGDPDAYDALRAQILQANGVTEEELRQYVEVHGENVDHMAEVWNDINTRLTDRSTEIQ